MTATAQNQFTWGTGRRKTAVARVRIRRGPASSSSTAWTSTIISRWKSSGSTSVLPKLTDMGGRIDVFVNVRGSGKLSQSGAVTLGLARALKEARPDLDSALRDSGFLTRDSRMVERKKFGHEKARKSFQFSKG